MSMAFRISDAGRAYAEGPPSVFVARAERQARVLERRVYLYRSGSTWIMTTHLGGLPSSTPVWMVPANGNGPERLHGGGL
jgi:hypothetical protein